MGQATPKRASPNFGAEVASELPPLRIGETDQYPSPIEKPYIVPCPGNNVNRDLHSGFFARNTIEMDSVRENP